MPSTTALLFPTGGAHWPGMGADFATAEPFAGWLDRADRALAAHGEPSGALGRLMAGEGQASRRLVDGSWQWTGNFPLSVAAQTLVGYGLAYAFMAEHGPPGAVVGESMGECAALGVTEALRFDDAVVLAYRWASALADASDALALRMAVVEGLTRDELEAVTRPLDAVVVVEESTTLFVVSLPRRRLGELGDALSSWQADHPRADAPVRMLVSANHCVAHDARLRQVGAVWSGYADFVRALPIDRPRLALWSALAPGRRLDSADAVRESLLATSFTPVRWQAAVTLLPTVGITELVLLGLPTRSYVLDKLRSEVPVLASVGLRTVRDLRAARHRRGVAFDRGRSEP